MWKSVENFLAAECGVGTRLRPVPAFRDPAQVAQALSACSACAGNYEDPDRTATMPRADDVDDMEEVDDAAESRGSEHVERMNDERSNSDEFPAKET